MSAGLPKHFDPERLAAHGGGLSGVLALAQLPRLSDMLATDTTEPVAVELRAGRDEAHRLVLTGVLRAVLPLTCQRCMEPVMQRFELPVRLAVVYDEEAARQLPAELDALLLESGTEADLPALVEDELLLALPPVPMHERREECGERARYASAAADEFDSDAKRENPFAVLKKLKNGNN